MELLSVEEVAQEFGVDRSTVWRWIRVHHLKTYRYPVGDRRTYLDKAELAKLKQPRPTPMRSERMAEVRAGRAAT
jgi:excisionase family DNA binding protein